ncbi:hypothetical protein [Nocardia abscessus]|uniref:hypothetical protein n=1 Tax=Nocardia abscessus TaxID=120957 RepID=UPI00245571FE|nr:hypothetical protein [Nocardia abscessus]
MSDRIFRSPRWRRRCLPGATAVLAVSAAAIVATPQAQAAPTYQPAGEVEAGRSLRAQRIVAETGELLHNTANWADQASNITD